MTHRCNPYLNNRIEQDHRGVKQRHYPMLGFGNFDAASRFCRAFDEQRQYFRLRPGMGQPLPEVCENYVQADVLAAKRLLLSLCHVVETQ